MLKRLLLLESLRPAADHALLALRACIGNFLIWGVWDIIVSPARMAEFASFLRLAGFTYPQLLAPLSVWVQFCCGAGFVLGLCTRWAGGLCAVNFGIALLMVDAANGIRAAFPAAALVVIGLYLGTHGAGRFSLDHLLSVGRSR